MDNEYRSNAVPMTYSEYRAAGRSALTGRWGLAVGVMVVAALLGGIGSGLGFNFSIDLDTDSARYVFSSDFVDQLVRWMQRLRPLFVLMELLGMVQFIIGGPIMIGYDRFNLHLVDRQEAKFGDLFSSFDIFGQAFWLRLRIALQIIGWTLLLIVPGIIAALRYSMAGYIMAEYPGISAGEAIERSKAMMEGHKAELFWLELSFIGWILLSALTLGILSLWVTPYMQATYAVFYRKLAGAQAAEPQEPDWTSNY